MSTWQSDYYDTSSSSATTNSSFFATQSPLNQIIRRMPRKVKRVNPDRPLAHLRAAEEKLKDIRELPSESMPTEILLFDPKDLVL